MGLRWRLGACILLPNDRLLSFFQVFSRAVRASVGVSAAAGAVGAVDRARARLRADRGGARAHDDCAGGADAGRPGAARRLAGGDAGAVHERRRRGRRGRYAYAHLSLTSRHSHAFTHTRMRIYISLYTHSHTRPAAGLLCEHSCTCKCMRASSDRLGERSLSAHRPPHSRAP